MKTETYLNTFYKGAGGADNRYAHEYLTGEFVESIGEYRIFERCQFGYDVFDIVLNGKCVGMYAGINGAKRRISELMKG